jgi:hypothetical protein
MRPNSTISNGIIPTLGFIIRGVVGEHGTCHANNFLAVQRYELTLGEALDLVFDIIGAHEISEVRGIFGKPVGTEQQFTHLLRMFGAGVYDTNIVGGDISFGIHKIPYTRSDDSGTRFRSAWLNDSTLR